MDGLRKQYKRTHSFFLNVFLGSKKRVPLNCTHCHKAIIFLDISADCPYCDYKATFLSEALILKECKKCKNAIKYFSCPYCQELILTDSHLPETKFFAKTYFRTPDNAPLKNVIDKLVDFLDKPENKDLAEFLDVKLINYITNFFHDFDMKSVRNATEKMEELHKQHLLTFDELDRLAKFNKDKAQSTAEHLRADLLKEAVKYYEKLPPLLQVYLITSLFGSSDVKIDDLQYDKEMREALIKIKEEEIRKMKIENDDLDDKRRRNNEI